MKPTARSRIRNEIDLPTPTAFWVLGAHLFVLFSIVPMLLLMDAYGEALAPVFTSPGLIYTGIAFYIAGVAFECSQNAIDRWYLTNTDEGFCDGLFYSFMIAGFSLMAMGTSNAPWVWAVAILVAVAHPIFYLAGSWVRFPLLTFALLLVDYVFFQALGQPVAFVHTLMTFAGLFFLALLMRTQAQWFHGVAALCFGLSFFAFPWAIYNYANGLTISWLAMGEVSAAAAAALGLLWPVFSKNEATTHRPELSRASATQQLA